jgi:transcriptional regulator with XRE-family HTH domain
MLHSFIKHTQKTQAQVAERMGTKALAVARLENALGPGRLRHR